MNELRDYIRGVLPLEKLVDRIEHEYMLLPKDKNGVPIHVGDKIVNCYLDWPDGPYSSIVDSIIDENSFFDEEQMEHFGKDCEIRNIKE